MAVKNAVALTQAPKTADVHFDHKKQEDHRKLAALWRFRIILPVAAFALAGCSANQAINASGQAGRCANDADCNPYNPVSYGQNNTGIGR
jgi:hypothetical protein